MTVDDDDDDCDALFFFFFFLPFFLFFFFLFSPLVGMPGDCPMAAILTFDPGSGGDALFAVPMAMALS